jgi:hypothetical protein
VTWREPAPGEREAGERSWEVVRNAFEERVPARRPRDWRPVVAVAIAAAVIAAALSPPGLAVLDSLRDAVRGEENAKPALFSLPASGRLLVNSGPGVWVVQRDGSKRLLAGYREAWWSPHGLYLAAVGGHELRALEPDGDVHWSIGRKGEIRAPRWSFDGFRIAYFARGALRVVNGDGTGDRLLTRDVRPSVSAWEPGSHALAYVNTAGNIAVRNVDRAHRTAFVRTRLSPQQLAWALDGRLVAVGPHAIGVFWRRGPQLRRIDVGSATIGGASVSPNGKRIAFIETRRGASTLQVTGVTGGLTREIFKGAGSFTNVVWSPDGRWLLVDWSSANQWIFIRSVPVRRIVAVSNIRANFGEEPTLVGWCCP